MNSNERATHWQQQIDQWQESGLSGAQFCKEHELDLGQFYYWSKKYSANRARGKRDKVASTGFATVVVADALAHSQGLRFTLPNGCAIEGITRDNVSLVSAMLAQL
jgi:hypothetical protein